MRAVAVVLLRCLLCLAALGTGGPARAAAYVFPGKLPPGCSGAGPSYTCGAGSLSYDDTVTINSPRPATITFSGDLELNSARINASGAASDLSLIVTGTLTPGYAAVINANLSVGAISAGSSSNVTFGGSVTGGSGALLFSDNTYFAGDVTTTKGAITLGQGNTVSGSVTSSGGAGITVGYAARVVGNVRTTGAVTLAQNARVDGAVTGGTGAVSIGYAATVTGAITTSSGSIGLTQSAVASACVQSTASAAITLGYGVSVTKVCCGALVSCNSNCVTNKSTYAMPELCPAPLPPSSLHHVEIRHASGAGLTCAASTVTLRACQDAACSTLYTGGVTGTLTATGSGMSVNWPSGAGFSIAAGSSSTADLQLVTAGSVLLGTSGLSPPAGSATTCNFGSPSCTWTAADSGLLFDVPNHVAGTAQAVSISAVKKSDNSLACTPAFASVSKSLNFRCSYDNPGSGTRAATVGGNALNSSNSANAVCDGSGRSTSLSFNASGVASTTLQYNDVGQLSLTASYAGSGSDAGLAMSGSDSFIAAPAAFGFSAITAGPIKAGSAFAATLSAYNSAGTIAPNFGREASAESARLAFVRIQPGGGGASSGSFTGNLGAFSGGAASASDLSWTEVGRGDLLANLTSGSYLGSGLSAYGASPAAGAVDCGVENTTCTLPAGVTATVYYGAVTGYAARTGVTGSIGCNNSVFGDPLYGTVKRCFYVLTSASNGSVGNFMPHHFDVTTTAACGSFSYAGQPFSASVTARNASGGTTVNYDGSAATSPNFAKAVTLDEATPLGVGNLGGNTIAASAFTAGMASASPSYGFTTKQTVPQTLRLRATDADNPGPTGYTEGSMALRSGRLRMSNAFGSAGAALQVPVVAEYWSSSGKAWVLNSADSCTTLAAASVVRTNPRSATGNSSAATSAASALSLASGSGVITLSAPSPAGSSLTLDLALNLGSTGADQSCQANHPASTGAAKAWLRAQNGACAATEDRDPAARASFGIFSPETRKTVHVREIF